MLRQPTFAPLLPLFMVVLLSASVARAAEPPPVEPSPTGEKAPPAADAPAADAPAAAVPARPPSPAAPAAQGGQDLSFDLFNDQPKQPPAVQAALTRKSADIERKVRVRRAMLKWHQGVGFATLGIMAATLIIGQLNYQDKYGGGDDNGQYYSAHLGLSLATTAAFAATGVLALFAPNPYPKKIRFDTALVHKVSMALATAGMVTQIVLGPVTAAREGHVDQRSYALAHLVSGYATFGFMSAGVLSYVF